MVLITRSTDAQQRKSTQRLQDIKFLVYVPFLNICLKQLSLSVNLRILQHLTFLRESGFVTSNIGKTFVIYSGPKLRYSCKGFLSI